MPCYHARDGASASPSRPQGCCSQLPPPHEPAALPGGASVNATQTGLFAAGERISGQTAAPVRVSHAPGAGRWPPASDQPGAEGRLDRLKQVVSSVCVRVPRLG